MSRWSTAARRGVGDVDWIFDPACLVDDDGQAYLYFGGGMPGSGDNARVIRLGEDMVSLADDSATTISAPDFFEAAFVHKRDGNPRRRLLFWFIESPPSLRLRSQHLARQRRDDQRAGHDHCDPEPARGCGLGLWGNNPGFQLGGQRWTGQYGIRHQGQIVAWR